MKHANHPIHQGSANDERGFSLAEVLVAAALLSVILLALFGLVTAGMHRAYGGKKMTQASVLAEAVMEQANVLQPQALLAVAASNDATESQRTFTWSKNAIGTASTSVTPAAEAASTAANIRNGWRNMLVNADLPANATRPATLQVTMTALPTSPTAATFSNATMVRVVVDLTWWEGGTRRRQVRLQALNLRTSSI